MEIISSTARSLSTLHFSKKASDRGSVEKFQAKVWDTYTFRDETHPLTWYKQLGFTEITEWMLISGNLRDALQVLYQKAN